MVVQESVLLAMKAEGSLPLSEGTEETVVLEGNSLQNKYESSLPLDICQIINLHRMGGCQVNLKTTKGKPQRAMPEE